MRKSFRCAEPALAKIRLRNNFLTPQFLVQSLQEKQDLFIVQNCKDTTFLLEGSIWAGYRMGTLNSWINTALFQLPASKFCLFVDEDQLDDEGKLQYFDNFLRKNCYKNYSGLCVGKRSQFPTNFIHKVNEIKLQPLLQSIFTEDNVLILDVRSADQARSKPMRLENNMNKYRNFPLDSEQLSEKFEELLKQSKGVKKLVTTCSMGYRSRVGYTLLRQMLKKKSCDVQIMASLTPIEEINQGLEAKGRRLVQNMIY